MNYNYVHCAFLQVVNSLIDCVFVISGASFFVICWEAFM